ncbi:putative Follistatin-A [Hypsibius exemplaris]|uniref:Follistatin-A n=1 Tax=Hypsibius exemplaris TaxID=2072580 RepID=A0A9X6ND81_HYPEX|nr:putative Follistatin-A [Hypsibius exemplaris]
MPILIGANGGRRVLACVFFTILSWSPVQGGTCWASVNAEGRCTEAVLRSISSREECCRIVHGFGGWTEETYDNGQAFFFGALGGGAPHCTGCSQSCDGIKCPMDKVCSLRGGSPHCACPTHCPPSTPQQPHVPVCSMEGITYRSECHMIKRNCRLGLIDSISYQGYCQHSCETVKCREDQHCIHDSDHQPYCVRCMDNCPDIYSPMCGTDGVTYDSMCDLNRASCRNKAKNIKYAHRGECNVSSSCSDVKCTGSEVCVLDIRRNVPRCVRCDLNCVNSELDRAGGAMCGSDGVTYPSWCKLRESSCNTGVLIHVERIGDCLSSTPTTLTTTAKTVVR